MSMNKILLAGIAGTFLAGSAAMAMEPVKLTNGQMDDVTAGARLVLGVAFTGGGGVFKEGGPSTYRWSEKSKTSTTEYDSLSVRDTPAGYSATGKSLVKTSASAQTRASGSFGGGVGEVASFGTFAASGTLTVPD